jgi:hypothetical protein
VRKLISFLLFGLITWQIIGFVGYFEFSHSKLKKEIKSLLKKGVPKEDLIQFTFSETEINNLTWLKKNEFQYQDGLYDVVYTTKHKNGLTSFECISDSQEKVLFARLGQTISNNLGDDDHQTPVSNWFKLIKLPYLSVSTDISLVAFIDNSNIENYSFYTKHFQTISFSIDSPPPQIS